MSQVTCSDESVLCINLVDQSSPVSNTFYSTSGHVHVEKQLLYLRNKNKLTRQIRSKHKHCTAYALLNFILKFSDNVFNSRERNYILLII